MAQRGMTPPCPFLGPFFGTLLGRSLGCKDSYKLEKPLEQNSGGLCRSVLNPLSS